MYKITHKNGILLLIPKKHKMKTFLFTKKENTMKITGIIAEYNPFHNGHLYQLNSVKKQGADYMIVVMSGDFVQRGTPAVIDKYQRCEMALKGGADLVIELPALFACSSAQYFARGAVSLLHHLGVVDTLCFGCETDQMALLTDAAKFLSHESVLYKKELQALLKEGYSFPRAREMVCTRLLGAETSGILNEPNNILALEYCISLLEFGSSITPLPLKREGSNYHEHLLNPDVLPSASAIRTLMDRKKFPYELANYVPKDTFDILQAEYQKNTPMHSNDFSAQLKYKLLLEEIQGYSRFLDITPFLSDKIVKNLNHFHSFDQFCSLLKSKDITYARISRSLLHILLHMTQADMEQAKEKGYAQYARILGFREASLPLLTEIKKRSSIPLISKLSDAASILTPSALQICNTDILAAHIYQSTVSEKYQIPFENEYKRQIIKY